MSEQAMSELRDEPFTPEILASAPVFEGAVWDVRTDRFRYGDGEIVRHYVDHPGAVAVVALDEDDRVLLIQQYRHPIRMRDWELPAGLRDVADEDPLLAAQRELAEETDLQARNWEKLLDTYTTPGGSNETIQIFLATGVSPAASDFVREAEEADMRVVWVPLSEAVAAVQDGRMRNAILVNGVLAAALRRTAGA